MSLIDIARAAWAQIRNETVKYANTATRVGDAGGAILDALTDLSTNVEENYATTEYIEENYAKKDSGVDAPESLTVVLNSVTPTYTITPDTPDTLRVSGDGSVCQVILPNSLADNKAVTIIITGTHPILVSGTSYAGGITLFADYDTSAGWSVNSILDPKIPDYSDISVQEYSETAVITQRPGGYYITGLGGGDAGSLIFINKPGTLQTRIYQATVGHGGNAMCKIVVAGTALNIVRVANGPVYYSQYDGKNLSSLIFNKIESGVSEVFHDNTLLGTGTTLSPLSVRMLELPMQTVVNGSIILENPAYVYKISTADNLTVTLSTSHVDTTQYIKFYLFVHLNDYKTITFPSNWLFANLDVPNQIGDYMYEVSSSDNGATWHLQNRYKNIATVGLDQSGNEIIGSVIRYVDGNLGSDTNDGLTWSTAYKNVQPAIDASNSGDAVFVKGSTTGITYIPTTLRTIGDACSSSFIMKNGVNIYGGFVGTETSLYQRQMVSVLQTMKFPSGMATINITIPSNKSILSGNISGTQSTNSYIVVYSNVSGNTSLNGFEITGGYGAPTNCAAGVSGNISTLVSNCLIYSNTNIGGYGSGGCYGINANNCLIYNNTASGGAYSGGGACSCILNNCAIYNNAGNSWKSGGGTYNCSANYCNIYGNGCIQDNCAGGCYGGTYINCCIYDHTINGAANNAGGAVGVTATNCSIYSNASESGTGGCWNSTLIDCNIYNNSGLNGGGTNASALTGCSISNNTALLGGGAYLSTLINCSVIRNSGGGTNNCILKNTVVWGNKSIAGTQSNVVNTNSSIEEYCAFENEERPGTGNISLSVNNTGDANSPYFTVVSENAGVVYDTLVCTLTLLALSYLIDKGLNSDNTSGYGSIYDILSNKRQCGTIDIGACEFQK